MTLEEGLFTFLLAEPQLDALFNNRIYALRVPEGETQLSLIFQSVSEPQVLRSHDGINALRARRIQMTVVGDDTHAVWEARDLLFKIMFSQKHVLWGDVRVQAVEPTTVSFDGIQPETNRYMAARDYIIWYEGEALT